MGFKRIKLLKKSYSSKLVSKHTKKISKISGVKQSVPGKKKG